MSFRIDTNIPYGNACEVELNEQGETARLAFSPAPHGGPETLWFCFRLWNDGSKAARLELALKHSYNMLGGHPAQAIRPVLRYADSDWQRLPAPDIEELPDGRSVVSWNIEAPRTWVDVAYCYPYGQPEIDSLLADTGDFWKRDVIGISQQQRPLVRLSNRYGATGDTRPGVYIVGRQHSGETAGSWVLDGFLRNFATLGDAAPTTWVVPLSNIDGIEQGDYGKDNYPYDLNRAWGKPPMRHETLVMRGDIARWSNRCRAQVGLDFHSPGACEAEGIYAHLPHPEKTPDLNRAAKEWTAPVIEALTPQYAWSKFNLFINYPSRWSTPNFATFLGEEYNLPALTFEVPYALVGDTEFTRERYQEAGARMADGIMKKINSS